MVRKIFNKDIKYAINFSMIELICKYDIKYA